MSVDVDLTFSFRYGNAMKGQAKPSETTHRCVATPPVITAPKKKAKKVIAPLTASKPPSREFQNAVDEALGDWAKDDYGITFGEGS